MQHKNNFLYERFLASIAVFLLFCTINAATAQTTQQTVLLAEDIAEKALAATVYLEMEDRNGKTLGFGSGFFIKPNLIATNYHVIEGAARGTAKLVGKSTTYTIEGITATDKTNDLVLLKVRAYGINSLPLGDSDTVRIGETVYVAGNPKGLEGTFSNGIISSRRDRYTKERLQMTAPISPGSSGGPVLNRKGEVIGVSFARHRALDAENLNFAIPSKYLKALLEQSKPAKPLSQKEKQSISADTYFLWGNAKYKLSDYMGAIADFDIAVRLKPDFVEAYLNRGLAKANLEQHFAAITDFDTAIRLNPDYALTYYNRGNVKTNLGQHLTAITDYDTAVRLKPDFTEVYSARGIVKAGLGQHFAAITDFDTAIRLKPDFALVYYNRGLAKAKLGRYITAIADYDMATKIDLNYAEAYLQRGNAKALLGQYFAAITDYTQALRLKPDSATAYFFRGNTKCLLGQHSAAIADYDMAIKIDLNYAEAYLQRGNAKDKLGRHFAAISDYDMAIRLKPNYAEVYLQRGNIKSDLKQYTAAIVDYDKAIRLDPNSARGYMSRGGAKFHLRRTSEAKRDFFIALGIAKRTGDKGMQTRIEEILQHLASIQRLESME